MFDDSMMAALAEQTAASLPPAVPPAVPVHFVTFTHPLPPVRGALMWEVIDEACLCMSWGGCEVFFHRRTELPLPPADSSGAKAEAAPLCWQCRRVAAVKRMRLAGSGFRPVCASCAAVLQKLPRAGVEQGEVAPGQDASEAAPIAGGQ